MTLSSILRIILVAGMRQARGLPVARKSGNQ
jgi:hypothetical protein